jgi:NitT/TauT family transport system permease protein
MCCHEWRHRTLELAPQAGAPILQPATPTAAPSTTATAVAADPAPSSAEQGVWRQGLVAALAWLLLGALTWWWPNKEIGFSDWAYTTSLPPLTAALAVLLAALALAGSARAGRCAGCGRRVPG